MGYTGPMGQPSRRRATLEDLAARGDPDRLEIVAGEIIEKAAPSADHSWSEARLVEAIGPFNRKPGGRGPGAGGSSPSSTSRIPAVILLVHRWSPDGYVVVQRAATGETVRPEPFDAIELRVGLLFDEDD
jgi:hypothetical protein